MKAKIKTTQKHNNKKKLVGAVSMLTVSALMLSTATYAWFTMSREVELQNIQMTATVPEDIQISLGHLSGVSVNGTGKSGLSASAGTLTPAGTGESATADDGGVKDPATGNDQTSMLDWSNTADISAYYNFGRLIPASSVDGEDIYFTPDADGVGKTVKSAAVYYAATEGLTAKADTTAGTGGSGTSLAAKLHAITAGEKSGTEWSATASTAYNRTNDDGYYVDIPIWLRTSSTAQTTLKVDAYVIPKTDTSVATGATDELYKATRVSILASGDSGDDVDASSAGLGKLLDLQDAWDTSGATPAIAANPYDVTGKSVLNWYGDKKNTSGGDAVTNGAVSGTGTLGTTGTTIYTGVADTDKYAKTQAIATLPASSDGTSYGQMKKYIVRVWLEGEDPECWNANAGQDWSISMRFSKLETTQQGGQTP